MDDQGDDGGDALASFAIGDLSEPQRQALTTGLADAGILHAFVGPELQGPAVETERIEHLVAQVRRGGRRRRTSAPAGASGPGAALPRSLRLPFGDVPWEALGLPIAPRWRRFAGYAMEALAFGLATAIIYEYSPGWAQLFAAIVGLGSAVVLVAVLGGTVGMMVVRTRVVLLSSPDREAPGWRVAIARYLVAWWPEALMLASIPFVDVSSLTWLRHVADGWLVVCFGPILFDPARRGLHDRATGTVVVTVDRLAA